MAYEKQGFQNGEELTAEHLERIEDGIVNLESRLDDATVDENGKVSGDLDMDGHAITNAWSVSINQKGKDGVAIYFGVYEAIDAETIAAVLEFYGTHGDEKVRLRNLAPGVNNDDSVTVGQMKAAVGDVEAALDSIIAIQKELMGIISFRFDSLPYEAEEGMTWSEWCSSEYNTGGYAIADNAVVNKYGTEMYDLYSGNEITADMVIVAGGEYGGMV